MMTRHAHWISSGSFLLAATLLHFAGTAAFAQTVHAGPDGQKPVPPPRTTLSDPAIRYIVPEKGYAILRRGPIEAVVVDNRAVDDEVLPGHRAGYHGVASLKHDKQPRNVFVPAYAGLNFEHIHDGTVQARDALFEPRSAPMELRQINGHTAELHQPPTPHWGLESCLRYELLADGVIEMTFECIPRRDTYKNGYIGLFWASYIHQPASLDVHFIGRTADESAGGWIRGVTPRHGELSTHRSITDSRTFSHDPDFPLTLVFNESSHRYTQPWYFGVCRGMALAQMFRARDLVRLSQSPSGGGVGNPAWDFQWFIPDYRVGQRYQLVMRAAYLAVDESDEAVVGDRVSKVVEPVRRRLDAQATETQDQAAHLPNAWVKQSPLADSPVSPRLGYEGACVWDSQHRLLVRYGGHNQGGGGEQGAEVWTFDPLTAKWTLKEPNTSPPGVCCNAQNLYDPMTGRYIRFPLFSGSHGWQWSRELYLNDSSVWTYDLSANRWRNMRPLPTPRMAPYRCASWDSDQQVAVVFGGEGGREGTLVYDPRRNEWRWMKPASEPAARSGGNMAYDAARKLHVLFGSQFTDDKHTWTYDLAANQWRDMQPPSMPPTDKNDAVLTYDPIHQLILAIVKVSTGEDESARHELQTWAYDAGANRWSRLNPVTEPDASGNRARQLIFAPELNLAILENCTGRPREQQIWTYRYKDTNQTRQTPPAQRAALPSIVEDAVVSVVSSRRVEITWTAPADPSVAGYHVERAVVEVWSEDQLRRLKSRTPPLAEPSVGAIRRIGPFKQLTAQPLLATSFTDEAIDLNAPQSIEGEPIYDRSLNAEHLDGSGRPYRFAVYAYRLRTVDAASTVGGPSPAFFTIPSAPQHIFSREDGATCHLKWAANAEQGVAGYRVYRMDGRWDSDSISRLTPDSLAPTTYDDATAGKSTRRYYIVAVDALGQEGFPSSPVWFQREWRDYYTPFVGPWHQ